MVNIMHSHLDVTIDHACHLGSRLVLAQLLAPQLFHICSWKLFEDDNATVGKMREGDDAHVALVDQVV